MTFFTVQVISLVTLKILPLKLYEHSSLMYLHSPHQGSLHFVTYIYIFFFFILFIYFFFLGGGSGRRGVRVGGGLRVDVYGEVKLL